MRVLIGPEFGLFNEALKGELLVCCLLHKVTNLGLTERLEVIPGILVEQSLVLVVPCVPLELLDCLELLSQSH